MQNEHHPAFILRRINRLTWIIRGITGLRHLDVPEVLPLATPTKNGRLCVRLHGFQY